MPQVQRRSDGDGNDDRLEALGRASDRLTEARRETDRARATSLRIFIDMALLEAATLLARAIRRDRNDG